MGRAVRVAGFAGVVLALLALAAYGVLYAGSQRMIDRRYDVGLSSFAAPTDPSLLAEGERLARIRGCIGCHGTHMQGAVFFDDPWLARIVAPDLTRIAQESTDAELERVIRKGVRRDGRTVWVMPSPMYAYLSDEDLGAIIAFIRSTPPHNGPATEFRPRLLGRVGIISGEFPPLADEIEAAASPFAPDRDDPMAFGHYLALTACSECHGNDLRGSREGGPSLAIVAAYSPEQFVLLMREGVALGERELRLMSNVSRYRFSFFTPAEVDALYAYLPTLGSD
jgi:mono/diheme cytochrome c family protein